MNGKAVSLHYAQQAAIRRAVVAIVVRLKDRFQPDGYADTPLTAPTPTPVATPFDSPAPAAILTGATKLPPVTDDDDMGQGDERSFVYNAPALPDPPSFNGSTKSEQRAFIPQWLKTFVMPVSACMDVFTKKHVAMWDMANRDYRCVTEAWVDSSSNAAELLISRAVMERLGFSEDELLSHAFAKQEVWDVSDVDKPSAMASDSRLTQVAASSDECGDDGMHCATPNIQVPSAEDAEGDRNRRRAVVEAVIQDKLRAAEDEGLPRTSSKAATPPGQAR
ncbi:hypothetical protein DYB31_016374 [Aphanomyces astaci]|uniref:Uncharacterized protein n=1 Tax=Aphanomyces astaci TaxID=112090 RepID=A0A397EQS8_APHAT|nr:hypothetical protein DYB31_016374 [Aphanomyces astaci]